MKYKPHVKIKIEWKTNIILLGKRAFLFCINDKCMSGMVLNINNINNNIYEIEVSFIEPEYFNGHYHFGQRITVNDPKNIAGEGIIIDILESKFN